MKQIDIKRKYWQVEQPEAPSPRKMANRPEFSSSSWTFPVESVVSTMTCSLSKFTVNDLIPRNNILVYIAIVIPYLYKYIFQKKETFS